MKKELSLIMLLILSAVTFAQNNKGFKKELLCKVWKLDKYQEANGKTYPALEEMKQDYLKYNCDGTFESTEMGLLIKGKWLYNNVTMVIIATQTNNKNYPAKIETKVTKLTDKELVVVSKDAEGNKLTLYMKPQ